MVRKKINAKTLQGAGIGTRDIVVKAHPSALTTTLQMIARSTSRRAAALAGDVT